MSTIYDYTHETEELEMMTGCRRRGATCGAHEEVRPGVDPCIMISSDPDAIDCPKCLAIIEKALGRKEDRSDD